ncbi:MAG TPA: non-heme iron oxygenase ferredoxin subunit [Candidatus Lustribacter sp.]|nr:non-heme iron oxygenase ferredoxin subunit [Candidatus Lustribacter sp.]
MTSYTLVCALDELSLDTPARAEVDGTVVALVRCLDASGTDVVYAVDDRCTHANVSLSEGEVDHCQIECWLHGSRFDLSTGRPSGPPATIPVATYPVLVQDGSVLVDVSAEPKES